MSGTTGGLPVAADWTQWAQGGYLPPAPSSYTPGNGNTPSLNPTTPAGAGSISPIQQSALTPAPLSQAMPTPQPVTGLGGGPAAMSAQDALTAPLHGIYGRGAQGVDPMTGAPTSAPAAPPQAPAAAPQPPAMNDQPGPAGPAQPPQADTAAIALARLRAAQAGVSPTPTPPPQPVPAAMPPATPVATPATPTDATADPNVPVTTPYNPSAQTRGMKLNNPGNLEYTAGQPFGAAPGADPRFGNYPTMQAGVAATARQLLLNQDAGLNTVAKQVQHWVSDPKADLTSYTNDVAKALGVGPNDPIDVRDPATATKFILAQQPHETGPDKLDPGVVAQGVQMGLDPRNWKAGAVAVAGPGASTGTPAAATAPTPAPVPATAPGVPGIRLPYNPQDLQLPKGSSMLALASGLLSGPNLSQGLGKGLQAMNQINTGDIANKRAINNEALAVQEAGMRNQYMAAMAGVRAAPKPTGVQSTVNGQPVQQVRDGLTGELTWQPMPGVSTTQQRANTQQMAMQNRFDPLIKANMSTGSELGKDAAEDITKVQNATLPDQQALAETQQMQQQIQAHPELMGPTLQARAARSLAEMGIAGDTNALSAIQKMSTAQRNTYVGGLSEHGTIPRSNAELNSLGNATASLTTSPEAAKWIVDLQQRDIKARMAWRDQLNELQTSDPASVSGTRYGATKSKFFEQYGAANPVPVFQDLTANPAAMSTPNASAGAPASGASPAAVTKVIHYDAKGNPIS